MGRVKRESCSMQCRAVTVAEKCTLFEKARAMSHTQGQDSSFDRRRPLVSDAPDWFNRARARANGRQVFQPRPVPRPAMTFAPGNPFARFWLRHKGTCLRVLPLVALPVVFAIGYWSRGAVGPAIGETASVGEKTSALAVAQNGAANETKQKAGAAGLPAEPLMNNAAPAQVEVAARVENQPAPGMLPPGQDRSGAGMPASIESKSRRGQLMSR